MSMENNIFTKMMKKLEGFIQGTNNIDMLMRDKVNPYVLVEEVPVPIQIGRYIIWVGNFTIQNNFKFWIGYGRIMALIGLQFENFDLLGSGGELYKAIHIHKRLHKEMCRLIYKTICRQQAYYLEQMPEETRRIYKKWKNMSLRYFIRHMSVEKLIQLCRIVYTYNFDPEKKNLSLLMFQLPQEGKETMRTYMASYLENMVGTIGKFQLAHLTKPSVSSDETIMETGMGNNEYKPKIEKIQREKNTEPAPAG